MTKSPDEAPITYLNKGQVYVLSITDTAMTAEKDMMLGYRTHVRVSFDDRMQRRDPARCWQLWKEGRGIDEAHQRGNRLQAVEFVESDTFGDPVSSVRPQLTLNSASVDGFVVKWSPLGQGLSSCILRVRFHFLSTDFSESKGVKGTPVRLCVKTEMISPGSIPSTSITLEPKICYCKVKLFRDHGAERKSSNDTAHVKKTIDKVKQKIAGLESRSNHDGIIGQGGPGRSSSLESQADSLRGHKRSWSSSFGNNADEGHGSKASLRSQLALLQHMLASSRPATSLFCRGDEQDDPDIHPAVLPHLKHDPRQRRNEDVRSSSRISSASASSFSSRASSPPRVSSSDFERAKIMPSLIPFEDYLPKSMHKPLRPSHSFTVPPENEYKYSPLKPDEVRLLALTQGTSDEAIHCFLKAISTSRLEGSQLGYQALSYAWGEEMASEQIYLEDVEISDGKNRPLAEDPFISVEGKLPQRFFVRPNLFAALKRLRSETEDLWFWIDALSINQDDDAEKSDQIPKMLDIFCNAVNVCIWLGETESVNNLQGARDPLDFISTIVNLKLLDNIVASEDGDEEIAASFVAFGNLLKRPWFRRRWVIQEVSASNRASVQCGAKKINWIDFADAVQLFFAKLERVRAFYNSSKLFKRDPEALAHVDPKGAGAVVQATDNVLRKREDGKVVARLWDIESLVSTFAHFEASDPRDTIYALLPLANDDHRSIPGVTLYNPLSLVPDYRKPTLQVYAEFVWHCVASSGSVDILCRHWALPPKQKDPEPYRPLGANSNAYEPHSQFLKPSWLGLTSSFSSGPFGEATSRLDGYSLVGDPGRKVYNASRGRLAEIRFDDFTLFDERYHHQVHRPAFYANGYRLASMGKVSPRTVDGIVPYDGLRLAGWDRSKNLHLIPDHLWRLLVADRAADGSKAPSWWRRACMYCLAKTNHHGDLNTSKLIDQNLLSETVLDYLKRVQAVVWNRAFFVCSTSLPDEQGLIGLGPRDVQAGDWACILFGCSVPVVLREHRSATGRYFSFIGECYIYGMMDGEALALSDTSPPRGTTWFNIH